MNDWQLVAEEKKCQALTEQTASLKSQLSAQTAALNTAHATNSALTSQLSQANARETALTQDMDEQAMAKAKSDNEATALRKQLNEFLQV